MMSGIQMTLLLCAGSLDFQQKVHLKFAIRLSYDCVKQLGAKAVVMSDLFGTSALSFLLDNVGCNGSESNLLDCLPQHNCHIGALENAGVQCLRKGKADSKSNYTYTSILIFEPVKNS